jgi:hypothetical protein
MGGYEFFWFEMYEKVAGCCDVASCCGALPAEGVPRKGTVSGCPNKECDTRLGKEDKPLERPLNL